MADEVTATGTQAEPVVAAQAATTETATQAVTGTSTDGSEQISLDEARKLRAENAALRKRQKDAEAKAQSEAEAKLGDLEKATKAAKQAAEERDTIKAALKQERAQRHIERAAAKLGLDGDLAASLVKPEAIEWDAEEQAPTNVEKLLKSLLEKWPQLRKPAPAQAASINGADGRGSGKSPANDAAKEAELRRRFRIG